MQESAVLAQSTPQTADVWLIRRIKEGNCKSGCCEEESGGGAGGGRRAAYRLNTDSTSGVDV